MLDSFSGQRPRYIIPALGRLYDSLRSGLAGPARHGWDEPDPTRDAELFMAFNGPGMDKCIAGLAGRGFPAPTLMGWLVALTEFVGGTFLAIGLLTRPATAAVFISMMVAVFNTHLPNGFFSPSRPRNSGNLSIV